MSSKQMSAFQKKKRHDNVAGYVFLIPAIITFLLFVGGPMIISFVLSFFDYNLIHAAWIYRDEKYQEVYDGPQVSKPYTCKAYRAKNKSDEDKINGALARMVEEDQTLRLENDVENHQTLIYGIGDQQLDVVARPYSESL